MVVSSRFQIVNVAGEVLAVPVGDYAQKCKDVFTFSDAGAFLLQLMKTPVSFEDAVNCLVSEYEIDKCTAYQDTKRFVSELLQLGLVDDVEED